MREEVIKELVYRFMTEPDYLKKFQSEHTRQRILNGYQLTQDEFDALKAMAPADWGLGRLEARISASTFTGTMAAGACACVCGNTTAYCKKMNCPPPPPDPPK